MKSMNFCKVGATMLAAALLASSSIPAFAASSLDNNNVATTNDLKDSDIIDESKKGTLTIYKYDITSAEKDGVYEEGKNKATATTDEDLEKTLANYVIKGVEFSYLRVGNVETRNVKNATENSAELVYEIPTELAAILGLGSDDAADMSSSNVAEPCNNTGVYHYTSQQINDAMSEILSSDNISAKNALEKYIKAQNDTVAMPKTDEKGYTKASDLKLGLYLIVETKTPEHVVDTVNPWFVEIPATNTDPSYENSGDVGGDYWFYDVVCYPKNQTGNPELVGKSVRKAHGKAANETGQYEDYSYIVTNDTSEKADYVADRSDYTYGSTVTASENDVLDYIVVTKLPHITSSTTYLKDYSFVDTLSEGIAYNEDVRIAIYDNADDAKVNNTANAKAIWSLDKNDSNYTQKYAIVTNADNKKTGETTMTVALTDTGLNEVNTKYSDMYFVVYYTGTVKHSAEAVLGDEGNSNDVVMKWERTSEGFYNTVEDRTYVYTYGIDLTKKFSDNNGDATKVQFVLYNTSDDNYIIAEKVETVNGKKVYYADSETTDKKKATVFSPAENGSLVINGLEADKYQLTEIGTDDGYSLLKNAIEIDITSASREIESAKAGYTSKEDVEAHEHSDACFAKDANGNVMTYTDVNGKTQKIYVCGFSAGENNGRTTGKTPMEVKDLTSGVATVDGIEAVLGNYAINADTQFGDVKNSVGNITYTYTDSANALVTMEITNSAGFTLPLTGGTATFLLAAAGIVVIASGIYVFTRNDKKEVG